MDTLDSELFLYEVCSGFDGKARHVGFVRRNGRRTPVFGPDWTIPAAKDPKPNNDLLPALLDAVCVGLNEVERRTWLALLDGSAIADLARQEGVSRTTVYERIRGKSQRGGMISKNRFVAEWWRRRSKDKTK